MSDVNKLMMDAERQLSEHAEWLVIEIQNLPIPDDTKALLCVQATMIKLRMSRVDAVDSISVLWEYPDELFEFLRSELAPDHLRASLEGGRLVDLNQPAQSVRRAP